MKKNFSESSWRTIDNERKANLLLLPGDGIGPEVLSLSKNY